MLRAVPLFAFVLASVSVLSCASDTVVQTGQIVVDYDQSFDFADLRTFSVVTEELAPPNAPEPDEDEVFFNNLVNDLIIDAMTAPPVCLEFVEPEEAANAPPDVWAANGLARTTDEGTVWQCQGGWWWGWWGWVWDPCAWLVPIQVEFDIGNLFIPVGPPTPDDEDPEVVFAGLAQSIAGDDPDVETKVRAAVEAIFAQWPIQRTSCE